jgi:hypothetical protein
VVEQEADVGHQERHEVGVGERCCVALRYRIYETGQDAFRRIRGCSSSVPKAADAGNCSA